MYGDWPVALDLVNHRIAQLVHRATQNPDAEVVVLGKYLPGSKSSYEQVARARGATYFELPGKAWDDAVHQLGADRMWTINRDFLDSQVAKGKNFEFTADPRMAKPDSFTAMEWHHLQKQGYKLLIDMKGGYYAVPKPR